jgi:hypothetical protein
MSDWNELCVCLDDDLLHSYSIPFYITDKTADDRQQDKERRKGMFRMYVVAAIPFTILLQLILYFGVLI